MEAALHHAAAQPKNTSIATPGAKTNKGNLARNDTVVVYKGLMPFDDKHTHIYITLYNS